MTHSPGSFSSHNDGSQAYMDLHDFAASLLITVITWLTLTNLFWPAATLSMINLQPRIRRSRCYSSCAHGTPMPLLPTTSAMPYFLRASDPSANFFARPSCSILTSWRIPFADYSRTIISSGDYSINLFGRLQHGLTFGRLLSQHLHFLWWFCFC